MIRIAIVDDHELVREGIKKVVTTTDGIAVAGEARDLTTAIDLLAHTQVDVLLLDLSLGADHELHALHSIRERFPALPVLVLSMHPEERFAVLALKAGAAGYASKAMAASEVVVAITRVASRGRYISDTVAELLADELIAPVAPLPHEHLTSREHDVLHLLGAGLTIKQVASQLDLSISSINTYRLRIFRKMGLRSNAALIHYTLRHRIDR
jgi:two-component system invasion response regulator UvrY